MIKRLLIIMGSLIGLVVVAGVIAYLVVPREKWLTYVTPEVRYVTVTNSRITDSVATMDVQLEVTSKQVPVFVDSLVYDFRLLGQSLSKGSKKFGPETKVGEVQTLAIPVSVNYKEARQLVQQQLVSGQKPQAAVDAWCRFPVVGRRKVSFTREVDIAVPVVPGVDLLGL